MSSANFLSWSLAVLLSLTAPSSVFANRLVSESTAQRVGLERAWFSQASIDASRSNVAGAALSGDTLCVLSSACVLQAFDTQSGATRWTTRIGDPGLLTIGPSINEDLVALVNGSTLFVIDAITGREIFSKQLRGAPGSDPAIVILNKELTDEETGKAGRKVNVFVPMVTGRIVSVTIDQDSEGTWNAVKRGSWNYNSDGTVFARPVVVGDWVVWVTSRGRLYGAYTNGNGAAYRFSIEDRLMPPAASSGPMIVVASRGGIVYGLDSSRGDLAWKTTLGREVSNAAVVSSGVVYVGTQGPALFAIDAETGKMKWRVDGVDEFLASSATTAYGRGPNGTLARIDIASGEVKTQWADLEGLHPIANTDSESIYLLSSQGLIQCLQEPKSVEAEEPVVEEAPPEAPQEEEPMAEGDPFAVEAEEPAEEGDDPFAEEPEAEPFSEDSAPLEEEEAVDEDDPFADF